MDNMNKMGLRWICLLCLLGSLWACSKEEALDVPQTEMMEVPFSFELVAQGKEPKTKAGHWHDTLKLNPRPVYVDRVMVRVYRRPSDQTYKDEMEQYAHYQQFTVPAKEVSNGTSQPRFIASGSVQLESGYDYRMTALAYSEKRQEDLLFRLNDNLFSYAEVELTENQEYTTPELFFGTVVNNENDTIIHYDKIDKNNVKLTGWLYRGVAGVKITLTDVPKEVRKIELLADSIYTRVKARNYDDFHNSYALQRDGKFEHFVLGASNRKEGETADFREVVIEGPNLLEGCTSLSLRITLDKKGGTQDETERVVTRLRVREGKEPEKPEGEGETQPTLRTLPPDEGNGTGIIPGGNTFPENPETPEDPIKKNPYRICFKRNHYYQMKGNYGDLTKLKYVLQVVVNPNWEGSINLPLDKSDAEEGGKP